MACARTAILPDVTDQSPDANRAMILIRFAISMFALTLLGLAISLSSAQSGQNERAEVPVLSQR